MFAALAPPRKAISQLHTLFANFFWGTVEGRNKLHWASWSSLCRPPEEGGLGIRSLSDMATAWGIKLWWSFITRETLWSKWLTARYCSNIDAWEVAPKASDSHVWRRMLSARDFCRDEIEQRDGHTLWLPDSRGSFSLTSAWDLIRSSKPVSIIFQQVWHRAIPLKISIFMWKLLLNVLPLDCSVQKRGIVLAPVCACCCKATEDVDHLFSVCSIIEQIWTFFQKGMGVHGTFSNFRHRLLNFWLNVPEPIGRVFTCVICWCWWKARNASRFSDIIPNIDCLKLEILSLVRDIFRDTSLSSKLSPKAKVVLQEFNINFNSSRSTTFKLVRWIPPTPTRLKLNTDGASKGNPGICGGGAVLRTMSGLLMAGSFYYGFGSNMLAEASALLSGLKMCNAVRMYELEIEVDSSVLVDLVLQRASCPPILRKVLQDIRALLQQGWWSIRHVYRECNQVADALANYACSTGLNSNFSSSFDLPTLARGALRLDKSGLQSIRFL